MLGCGLNDVRETTSRIQNAAGSSSLPAYLVFQHKQDIHHNPPTNIEAHRNPLSIFLGVTFEVQMESLIVSKTQTSVAITIRTAWTPLFCLLRLLVEEFSRVEDNQLNHLERQKESRNRTKDESNP